MTILEQYIANNNFGKMLGMNFKVIEPGLVHYYLTITQTHLATPLAAHGGAIAALIDAALGVTCLSVVQKDNMAVSTIEFKINFLKPALLNDELLAIGKLEQQGKHLLVASSDVICIKNNTVIAKAIGTFNCYPANKAGFII